MDLQDPKIQRLLIAGILSAGILYLFFGTSMMGLTYPAQKANIAELTTEHEKLSRELERARLIVGNMAKLEREVEFLHRQWSVAQGLLPEQNEMSPLLRQITAAGTQSGLEFVRFEPQPSIGHGFYTENPISVELEGGYHQVGSFISSLANLDRIINVRALNLVGVRPMDQGKDDMHHTVTASMEIVSYSIDHSVVPTPTDVGTNPNLTQGQQAPGRNTVAAANAAAGGH
jgi:type IV pilus assembly protein PilO